MIPVEKLIAVFQQMYQEHWQYKWGSHEKGCVDCSGAFTYAYSLFGYNIPNGSNAIARKFIKGKMLPIGNAKPGMIAFKSKLPGEDGYDLKDKYKQGGSQYNGDLADYYHVGLVDDDPRYVLNAKGEKSGFCRDALSRNNGWDCVAFLKDVDYGEEQSEMPEGTYAKVVLPQGANGTTVNLRQGPSKDKSVVAKVPVGTEVQVVDDKGTWCEVNSNGQYGWMMSNYLEYVGQDGETDTLTPDDRDKIDKALLAIENATEIIGGIIGRG